MKSSALFIHYLTISRTLGYFLIFLGMIIEGDILLFTAGFLTQQKNFDLGDIFLVVLSGALIGDILWYYLGFRFNHSQKFSFMRVWMDKVSKLFDAQLQRGPFKTIFVAKFLYGLHHISLIVCGNLKFPIKKLLKIDTLTTIVWIILVGGLGYIAGFSFFLVKRYLHFIEIGLLLSIICFFLLLNFISRYLKKKLKISS